MPSENDITQSDSSEEYLPDTKAALDKDIASLPQDEQGVMKNLIALLGDDKQRRLFMRALKLSNQENTKPVMWSKRSNPPYYRKHFALELKEDIDKLLANKSQPLIFEYCKTKLSKKSLQLKINQSFMFLVEEMDTEDFYYRNARDHIAITSERAGIQLTFVDAIPTARAQLVVFGDLASVKLKRDVEDWLETSKEGSRFERSGLQLSDEEVKHLKDAMIELTNVHYSITNGRVLILKLTEQQVEDLQKDGR